MIKIIVPTDFTSTANVALKYAVNMAEIFGGNVTLMHIIADESSRAIGEKKLAEQCALVSSKKIAPIDAKVYVGDFLVDIPQFAKDEEAGLVVMGTHGIKGLQYVTGSHALKVISNSEMPYIIVQEGSAKLSNIKKLLLPLDLHKETKQKLNFCGKLAQKLGAEVALICPKENDEYLNNQVQRNMGYAEGYLEDLGVPYTSVVAESPSSGFVKDILSYAAEADVDLICVLNFAYENFFHFGGKDEEQKIITNPSQIPVLIMNPKDTMVIDKSVFAQ
jgi:nucleotide-binding universal stress UspA family protein